MHKIYFDHSATTPLSSEVFEEMKPYFSEKFGNSSSLHFFGQEAKAALEDARKLVADVLVCSPAEIYFTSGGTESDNLALKGIIKSLEVKGHKYPFHIITSKIEHPAILNTAEELESLGVEVTYLNVDSDGLINADEIKKEIKDNTVLISVMYANNEVGTIQPIEEISKVVLATRETRENGLPIYLHTDAVQVGSYLSLNTKELGVDLMSLSGHKFYGPKGVGVLFRKKGVFLEPIQVGGGHERGLRSGTENIPGIIGFAKALVLAEKNKANNFKKVEELRDYLIKGMFAKIEDISLTGHPKKRLPNLASFLIKRIEGESMLINLDLKGVAVSTGSACSSGSLEPSHVLKALGLPLEEVHGSIRISLGIHNTKQEIDYFLEVFPPIVEKLRALSPL
jgi:cysteine desulfurase